MSPSSPRKSALDLDSLAENYDVSTRKSDAEIQAEIETKRQETSHSEKDTCGPLVDICRAKQLFTPFYDLALKATGTIRNKMSDAHGRGPAPQCSAKKEHADHMIRLASTNITFLVSRSEL
jgi:Abortive infection C-terminus